MWESKNRHWSITKPDWSTWLLGTEWVTRSAFAGFSICLGPISICYVKYPNMYYAPEIGEVRGG